MVLKDLTALRGVAGDEGAVRDFIAEAARALNCEVNIDRIGNVIAVKRGAGGNGRGVILSAHMDEIGMIVTDIKEEGLLAIAPVGAVDPRIAVSKRVTVGKSAHPGVIGANPIHLQSDEDEARVVPFNRLMVDIGAKDKAAAEKRVSRGDFVCFDSDYVEFGDGLIKSRALDDRVGCLTILRALEKTYPVDVTGVFTVQEEVGLRGATAAGHHVRGDCAIILEGTSANDLGDVDEHLKVCKLGAGVAISFMDLSSVAHRALNAALRDIADECGIPWQVKTYVSGGNDAGMFQRGAEGMPTCVLSVPCRYIHSPSNVAKLSDIDAQYALVDAFLASGAKF